MMTDEKEKLTQVYFDKSDWLAGGRSDSRTIERQCGMHFHQWLTLLFIALKLTGDIEWAWWWVLSPLMAGAFLGAIVEVAAKKRR